MTDELTDPGQREDGQGQGKGVRPSRSVSDGQQEGSVESSGYRIECDKVCGVSSRDEDGDCDWNGQSQGVYRVQGDGTEGLDQYEGGQEDDGNADDVDDDVGLMRVVAAVEGELILQREEGDRLGWMAHCCCV